MPGNVNHDASEDALEFKKPIDRTLIKAREKRKIKYDGYRYLETMSKTLRRHVNERVNYVRVKLVFLRFSQRQRSQDKKSKSRDSRIHNESAKGRKTNREAK